jgi:hypothetical protein
VIAILERSVAARPAIELIDVSTPAPTAAFAHLAADHLAAFAERVCALRAVDSEIVGTKKAHDANGKGLHRFEPFDLLVAGAGFGTQLRVPLDARARQHAA